VRRGATVNRAYIAAAAAILALGGILAGCAATASPQPAAASGGWVLRLGQTPSYAPSGASPRAVVAQCSRACDGAQVIVTSPKGAASTYSVTIGAPVLSGHARRAAVASHIQSNRNDGAFYDFIGITSTKSGRVSEYIAVTSFRGRGRGDRVSLVDGSRRVSIALPVGK